MARIPDNIKDINGSKETLKLIVRITDLWFLGTRDKSEQAEMVIVDSNGDQIHAVCKQDQLKSWKPVVKENCTYMMHNFKVVKNDGQYKICAHPETDLVNVPLKTHSFIKFVDVISGNLERDIIGVVDEVVFQQISSKNTRVVFKLKDLSEQLVLCTPSEDYCMEFLEYLNECNSEGPIIIPLTHARIKESQGSYPTTISNSLQASKLLINQPMPKIEEFKQRFLVLWLGNFCVIVGTNGRIVMKIHSWCYATCIQCNKKTDIDNTPFTCAHTANIINKLKECTKFLLLDRECTDLIGHSDGDVDLNASPEALDKILGYTLALKVKVQPKFRNSIVLKYSFNSSLMNTMVDLLPDAEVLSCGDLYCVNSSYNL
ncbi:hypothetical protein GmHk_07G020338 [Glycine max]|nr:hypothetical protein GmHk_07G020338 [Glycine max]